MSLGGRLAGRRVILFPCVCSLFSTITRRHPVPTFRYKDIDDPVSMVVDRRSTRKRHFHEVSKLARKCLMPNSTYDDCELLLRVLEAFRSGLRRRVRLRGGVIFPGTVRLRRGYRQVYWLLAFLVQDVGGVNIGVGQYCGARCF